VSRTELDHILLGMNAAIHEIADPGGLIDQLRELLAEKSVVADETGGTSRPTPGSRPPWDAQAAHAYTAITAWARHAEADLGTYVHGRYIRRATSTDRGTRDALGNVLIFCEDGRVPEAEVRRVARGLGTLLRAAQSVPAIDTAPPAAATLRQPCPVCGDGELTAALDGSTEIRCVNEMCGARWAKKDWPFLLSRLTQGAA
jgi:hypothetical protein